MPTDFAHITAALRDLGGQRVWSLMISLFGDLAQDKGQAIDGPVLSAIMAELQIKPEAARVALHRLRNDGWITSEKSGRISQHSLSAKGRAESAAASPRIYADPRGTDTDWQLVLTADAEAPGTEDMAACGFAPVAPRVFVGPATAKPPPETLSLRGTNIPDWLRQQAEPQDLRGGYEALLGTLTDLQQELPDADDLTPVQTAVLRCLIVHNWRRLVLKHPALPAPLVDPDWPGHRCHLAVADLLGRFPRPALSDIEDQRAAA